MSNLKNKNSHIFDKIKTIAKIVYKPVILKEFDKETFDSIIEGIIIGEVDENENNNPDIVRFILKTVK